MLNFILLIFALGLIYRWLNQKPKNFPPGPPTVPFFGSFPFINSYNFHLELEKMKVKYGPVIGFKFGVVNAIGVTSLETCLEVLKREEFNGRAYLTLVNRDTDGIMFANGTHWRDQRRFALRHLREFGYGKKVVDVMIKEEIDEFCLKKMEGKSRIQVSGLFNTCAINILWEMIGGKRMSYDDEDFHDVLHHLQIMFRQGNITGGVNAIPLLRPIISLFKELETDTAERKIKDFFLKALDEHRKTKTDVPRDLMDMYIDEIEKPDKKPSFTVDTMLESFKDLFSAGTESSSNTISFAILYLIHFPEWYEKVEKEIDAVLGGRSPTWEDRHSLPLVDAFIAETQRSNTIAPFAATHMVTKDTYLNGYFLPERTNVLVNLWSVMQDKKYWGDPENFRPERFLDSERKFIKDPNLIIFGAGARICAGETLARQFVFLFFVSLLQKYKFTLPKGQPLPTLLCKSGFTTAPHDFSLDIHQRK